MMKVKILLLSSLFALAGCDKLGQKAMDAIPNPSPAQEQVAVGAYNDLRDKNFDEFLTYLEPELQAEFNKDTKTLRKFSYVLPKSELKHKKIVSKKIEKSTDKPSLYTVTYEYSYDKNLVQYDVSFDKPNGSTKIRKLNVAVFGESTN